MGHTYGGHKRFPPFESEKSEQCLDGGRGGGAGGVAKGIGPAIFPFVAPLPTVSNQSLMQKVLSYFYCHFILALHAQCDVCISLLSLSLCRFFLL